ncbi:unnamed protein product [Pieris macdunnoughi]|uniref:Uncharacterized protein n=1 Tax=Pieris macdunnoughi TaxID=345717 RepID=A0A821WG62_9NEOP|nr:unnamed protein product [Pieris macdunnoughi]
MCVRMSTASKRLITVGVFQVSSLEAPRRAVPGPTRLDLERRSLDLERELRVDRDSDASLDDRDHLV